MNCRRNVVIAAVLALLTAVAVGALAFFHVREPYPVRAYQKIELGMTQGEADAAIGYAPGDYSSGARSTPYELHIFAVAATRIQEAGLPAENLPPVSCQQWAWDNYWIQIAFDADGKAVRTELLVAPAPPPTLFERLRQWLRL